MGSSPSTRLEVAKELTLKAMEKMRTTFQIPDEQDNEKLAQEIDKLFKSIHKTVTEADRENY